MTLVSLNQTRKGDCECCIRSKNVELFLMHGNMWMCAQCRTDELSVMSQNAHSLIQESKRIDASIQVKQDVFNAKTIPIMELHAAIQNDSTIAAEDKEYTFTKMCQEKSERLAKVIFDKRADLLNDETELRAWQSAMRESASKLRADIQAQFPPIVTYQPTSPTKKEKTTKPATESTRRNKSGMTQAEKRELYAACEKYSIPNMASQVQGIKISHPEWSIDACAKYMAELLGKVK